MVKQVAWNASGWKCASARLQYAGGGGEVVVDSWLTNEPIYGGREGRSRQGVDGMDGWMDGAEGTV